MVFGENCTQFRRFFRQKFHCISFFDNSIAGGAEILENSPFAVIFITLFLKIGK